MNVKDKEKLKLAGTIVSFAKGDPIVIDPEEYEKKFGNKKKEVETEQTETDAEKLSVGIVEFLAESAANSFAEILQVIPEDMAEVILDLLNKADSEMFVTLLQTVFSLAGMEYAAEQLELIEYCYEYDDCAYFYFEDEFIDNDAVEAYFTEQLFKDLLQDEHGNGKRR